MSTQLLRALVGSRAHGLHNEDSDTDYRGVFVMPTEDVYWDHAMGKRQRASESGKQEDDVNYEVGHFLKLALGSNPSILEIVKSPKVLYSNDEGRELIDLFDDMWSSIGVKNAFGGYADKGRRDYIKTGRMKAAVSSLRISRMGTRLLLDNTMSVEVSPVSIWRSILLSVKNGDYSRDEVIRMMNRESEFLDHAYEVNPHKQNNPERVKEFLLSLRRKY